MITKMAFVAQPTTKMAEMKAFYGTTLGLASSFDVGVWAEFTTPEGKTVALDTHSAQMEGATCYLALESDDIDTEVQRLKDAGAVIAKDVWSNEHEGQHMCKMAIVVDPDGNALMIHQIAPERAGH